MDVNNALNGDGPFSPERAGGLPVLDLVKLCYSGKVLWNNSRKGWWVRAAWWLTWAPTTGASCRNG